MNSINQKSLKLNMILNGIKGLMSILFPLISFPYISKILDVDNLGKYNFANSIISYFILIAGLGISTYAIREGSKVRDCKEKFKNIANQMFTINIASTVGAYILLFVLLFVVPKFHDYKILLLILSLQIFFKTIGIEWIYSIYEDYMYITVRSIVFQLISLGLMFMLIKTNKDVNVFAIIIVVSSVGSNIFNYFHAQKYCRVHLTKNIDLKKHIKPILVLFAMAVTVSIYVSSDITILGFIKSDYNVGIYSVSVKIYSIVKTILSSVLIVSIPRLSLLWGKRKFAEFNDVAIDIYETLLSVLLPSILGLIMLSKDIILVLSDESYLSATDSLVLLSIALFFCLGAWFWGQCILIPSNKETIVFKATVVSAVVNIGLNFLLIPFWAENAAAFTTVIAEGIAFIWCRHEGIKRIQIKSVYRVISKVLVGCCLIVTVCILIGKLHFNVYLELIISLVLSMLFYGISQIFLKNQAIYAVFDKVFSKISSKQQ